MARSPDRALSGLSVIFRCAISAPRRVMRDLVPSASSRRKLSGEKSEDDVSWSVALSHPRSASPSA